MQEKMTAQEVFDTVTKHLLKQNQESLTNDGASCAYRGDDGLKCAVGCLIEDDEYHEGFEGKGIATLVKDSKTLGVMSLYHRLSEHILLLQRLQIIHDRTTVSQWPKGLKDVAEDYQFRMPEELKERLKA